MHPGFRWSRRERFFERATPAGLLLLGDGDAPLRLTGPALAMWDLLAEPMGIDDLLDRLADTYVGDRDTMRRAALDSLESLVAEGLVDRTRVEGRP